MTEFNWPLMHNNVTRSDLDKMIEYLEQDDPKLTHGPLVKKFEEEWSKWLGVKHSVMLNSGSSATMACCPRKFTAGSNNEFLPVPFFP